MIYIIGVIFVLVLLYIFVFSGKSIGPKYKRFLQETQSILLRNRFPMLTDGDLYDIQTTHSGDLVRWILQQEYYQLYINGNHKIIEKLMDTGMSNAGDYNTINKWMNGTITKRDAIGDLNDRDPDIYRMIFNQELQKY